MENRLPYDADRVQKAWLFAAHNHQGQLYPSTGLPYLTHIGSVCLELLPALHAAPGLDAELTLCCAALHDTLEDTEVTLADLTREFGSAVAAGVSALTKDKAGLRGEAATLESLARIRRQPHEVWLVKLADRAANLGVPPARWTREKCHAYAAEGEQILRELGSASPLLATRLSQRIAAWRAI